MLKLKFRRDFEAEVCLKLKFDQESIHTCLINQNSNLVGKMNQNFAFSVVVRNYLVVLLKIQMKCVPTDLHSKVSIFMNNNDFHATNNMVDTSKKGHDHN